MNVALSLSLSPFKYRKKALHFHIFLIFHRIVCVRLLNVGCAGSFSSFFVFPLTNGRFYFVVFVGPHWLHRFK